MRLRLALAALAALSLTVPAAAQLSRAEQAMVRTVDFEQERTLALLEQGVNQNSGTLNFAGVEAVAQMARPVDWQLIAPQRPWSG